MLIPLSMKYDVSFFKLMTILNESAEINEETIDNDFDRQHRRTELVYNYIKENRKDLLNLHINEHITRLTDLALNNPYGNQDYLLLIQSLNSIQEAYLIYDDLSSVFSDIKFIYIKHYDCFANAKKNDSILQPFTKEHSMSGTVPKAYEELESMRSKLHKGHTDELETDDFDFEAIDSDDLYDEDIFQEPEQSPVKNNHSGPKP